MALIILEGMRFFAHHGYYEEETILGNDFILDLVIQTDTEDAAAKDELYHHDAEEVDEAQPTTVNYEIAFHICQAEMRKPAKLLETVANRIAERISDYFDEVDGVLVRLQKLNPPLGGRVHGAAVVISIGTIDLTYLELVKKLGK